MKHEDTRIALNTPEFPAVLQRAGAAACFAADEFFSARISNWETRRAYARAVRWFFKWCDAEQLELAQITPGIAGRFIRSLKVSDATKNQTLAAMRHFFDILVERHAVVLNPFHSVRGIKYKVIDGKTPEITIAQARTLVASIDLSLPIGLRDRAILGTMITTGCRVGALCRLRLRDLQPHEDGRTFRFREKNGKEREIPVRHDLDQWIDAYLQVAGIAGDPSRLPALAPSADALGRRSRHAPPSYLRRPGHAQDAAGRRWAPHPPDASFLPRHGRDRSTVAERARRGGPTPSRTLPPVHHPALRPPKTADQPEHRRAHPLLTPLQSSQD